MLNRRQDWYAFTFLSGSPVRTITRAALQIPQSILTAALDVWLTHFFKVSLPESFPHFERLHKLHGSIKEQSQINSQHKHVVPKTPNPFLRFIYGVFCFWSFPSTVHAGKKISADRKFLCL